MGDYVCRQAAMYLVFVYANYVCLYAENYVHHACVLRTNITSCRCACMCLCMLALGWIRDRMSTTLLCLGTSAVMARRTKDKYVNKYATPI